MSPRTPTHSRPSRRRVLTLGGTALGGMALATTALPGCDLSTSPAGQGDGEGRGAPGGRTGGPSQPRQSPMLASRVRAGTLPPLARRLPDSPLVVKTVADPGRYGGELRSAILGPGDVIQLDRLVGYECLLRWTPDWSPKPAPNIAESVEVNGDATQFTVRLRPGMRWSTGDPFTADDIVFAQNDIFNNTDIYPGEATNPVVAEKLDDHTVRLTFEQPNSLFLQLQASTGGLNLVTKPMAYLKQFHKKYNPDADAAAKKEKHSTWTELLLAKTDLWGNPDLPTLGPWQLKEGIGQGTRVVLERNPYYWKVDAQGRQLPYVDQVTYAVISEPEVILTRVLHGEIDFQLRPSNTLQNKPVLARNRASGGFHFVQATPSNMNTMAFCFNLTHADPVLRGIFGDKRFRIGVSHAIDRKEIIAAAYQKQGAPYQAAPRPESEFYDKTFATQYTEHDPAKAADYLDRVLPDKDGQGFRLRPDGDRLSMTVEFALGIWPEYPDVLELVKGYCAKVGLDLVVKGEDRSLFDVRTGEAQKHDVAVWQGAGGWNDIYLNPYYYLPVSAGATYWARGWWEWYLSDGKAGDEPPAAPLRQLKLYDRMLAAARQPERASLMKEILEIAREEFYVIGINLQPQEYATVSDRLRNVPEEMPNSWVYPTPGPTHPEQYFLAS